MDTNLGTGSQGPVQRQSEVLGLQGCGGTQTCGQGDKKKAQWPLRRNRFFMEYWEASWESKTAAPSFMVLIPHCPMLWQPTLVIQVNSEHRENMLFAWDSWLSPVELISIFLQPGASPSGNPLGLPRQLPA